MKRVALKIFILVRDNVPAHISEATQQSIKERRWMNWKIGQLLAQIWIPLKMYGGIIKMELEKKDLDRKNELIEYVREAYNQISEDTIFNLVESFQRRMIKCIETM